MLRQYPDFASAVDLAGTNDPLVLTEVSGRSAYMHPLLLQAAGVLRWWPAVLLARELWRKS
jgi:hypothetical protein